MGRQFEGEAFKPTPTAVLFKDFEVGPSYSQVVILTNISLARNTFKVGPSQTSQAMIIPTAHADLSIPLPLLSSHPCAKDMGL